MSLNVGAVKGHRQARRVSKGTTDGTHEGVAEDHVTDTASDKSSEPLSHNLDSSSVGSSHGLNHESGTWTTFFSYVDITSDSQSVSSDSRAVGLQTGPSPGVEAGSSGLIGPTDAVPGGGEFQGQSPLEYSATDIPWCDVFSAGWSYFSDVEEASDTTRPSEGGLAEDGASHMATRLVDGDNCTSNCTCPASLLDTWEFLTINVASRTATADRLVQCQKVALSNCESLVRCRVCSTRPQYISLLSDICAKLLESLKSQSDELPPSSSWPSGARQTTPGHPAEYRFCDHGDGDSNDRDQVLRSLWMARMQRLGDVIARAGDMLEGEQWAAHKGLLRSVQVRFVAVMFGWKHI